MIRGVGWLGSAAFVLGISAALSSAGCSTEAFCFSNDCDSGASSSSGSGTTGAGGDAGCLFNCSTGSGAGGEGQGGSGGGGPCTETNGGIEICDGTDNDCNGEVDDIPGLDLTSVRTCGSCSRDCLVELTNADPATISCNQGQCEGTCADDFYDLDGDGSCEYYCLGGTAPESACNGIDDDCDGTRDEDIDLCTSTTSCGACGRNCVVLHGTATCVHTGGTPCTLANTRCAVETCDCPDAQGNCWWNIDGRDDTGCEYQCQRTNGGVEICDGIDNDCDGLIDGADDLSGDAQVGVGCTGDPDGECATAAHLGATACQGGRIVCAGPNVLVENQQPELCNGLDDDCDGAIDDSPSDAGRACGVSAIFPCSLASEQCQGGRLVCVGAIGPIPETCNGIDDDCDGTVDATGGVAPADSVGPCNVPPDSMGIPQPCRAGTKACVSAALICQGSIGPTGPVDTCGVDANCDGLLTNQPDLMTDVANCGSCTNDCYAGAVHSNWRCEAGTCRFQGCAPGYYDLDGDQRCEYACVFIQATETCNGVDDNCNGAVDEDVVAPSPVQVCGVSPTATTPECSSGVTVTCSAGAWRCSFPSGVCNGAGGCAGTPETCDTVDNNCNGLLNENVPNFGRACNSDEGLPPPGHGACRTSGVFVCNGPNATRCNAAPADCSTLPGGCTEQCDGIDNDCDGSIDEPFAPLSARGANPAHFVRPVVTQIAASLYIYAYEASRPTATDTNPGVGNGFHTSAPAGTTLDRTPACSVPNKIPWFNVTPSEAEQTCTAMGGSLCSTTTWQTACQATAACRWGYNPRTAACRSAFTPSTKFCNLGPSLDFNTGATGDQDGLLPTASAVLRNCSADWSSLFGNTAANNRVFDITGNLREITRRDTPNQYSLMGGAFNTATEAGAECGFTFYTVDQNFKFFDTGFRCCFTSNPTL